MKLRAVPFVTYFCPPASFFGWLEATIRGIKNMFEKKTEVSGYRIFKRTFQRIMYHVTYTQEKNKVSRYIRLAKYIRLHRKKKNITFAITTPLTEIEINAKGAG